MNNIYDKSSEDIKERFTIHENLLSEPIFTKYNNYIYGVSKNDEKT